MSTETCAFSDKALGIRLCAAIRMASHLVSATRRIRVGGDGHLGGTDVPRRLALACLLPLPASRRVGLPALGLRLDVLRAVTIYQ